MIKYAIEKSFDFSIRVTELVKHLQSEGLESPLSERLLLCSTRLGAGLRISDMSRGKEKTAITAQTLAYAVECAYLLELLAKTGYLTEMQSKPIRTDCKEIVDIIGAKQNAVVKGE